MLSTPNINRGVLRVFVWLCGVPLRSKKSMFCWCSQAELSFPPSSFKLFAVPRKNPLSKRELAICARVKSFRTSINYPRRLFANHAGLDSSTLIRIELARVPLRYDVAKKICDVFTLNPTWLADGGKATMRAWRNMPASHDLGVDPKSLFSEVFDAHLAPLFLKEDHA
jgi:transcriptional regulator with XRE-family HTH domain